MKQAIALILTGILLLSLAACGAPVAQEAEAMPTIAATPEPAATPVPTPAISPEEQEQLAICEEIIKEADTRRESILNSPTEVTVTGTSYYVSSEGNDENDGLSPETPWRTVAKVNTVQLQPGDGVFFRRGDVWREVLANDYEDITYSAYGEGAKPEFYDSPENGGGAEKWTLLTGTDNIWVYQTPMPMLGSITFNRGEAVASQHLSYWNGKEYTEYGTDDVPVDITGMKNMRFFVDIDLTECQKESWRNGQNGDLYVYSLFDTGTVYLRCDEGNPGALYSNIEFARGGCMCTGGGCVIDNLCMLYMGNGVMPSPETLQGVTVKNCEIAFVGDTYISFEKETKHGVDGGECFSTQGY
ncbi:MAG: hypothetical protein PHO41_05910, partial [Eubacteriales bacterium]|nr:hypothetical protein [Eubacteriales bacterium]